MAKFDHLKQIVWRMLYPVFPLLKFSLSVFHAGRQRYHLGWLAPGKSLEDLKAHLAKQGFGNHFVAWDDSGQVLSWRKFDGFDWQYHLRVFDDGEIRGHYEKTPESAPIDHFSETGEEPRTPEFLAFFGDLITHKRHITRLKSDPTAKEVESQITFS